VHAPASRAAVVLEKVPAWHGRHASKLTLPVAGLYVPAAQSTQAVPPAPHVPELHLLQPRPSPRKPALQRQVEPSTSELKPHACVSVALASHAAQGLQDRPSP
jgi:hypothetical protein